MLRAARRDISYGSIRTDNRAYLSRRTLRTSKQADVARHDQVLLEQAVGLLFVRADSVPVFGIEEAGGILGHVVAVVVVRHRTASAARVLIPAGAALAFELAAIEHVSEQLAGSDQLVQRFFAHVAGLELVEQNRTDRYIAFRVDRQPGPAPASDRRILRYVAIGGSSGDLGMQLRREEERRIADVATKKREKTSGEENER